jgi:hypothetical protein
MDLQAGILSTAFDLLNVRDTEDELPEMTQADAEANNS